MNKRQALKRLADPERRDKILNEFNRSTLDDVGPVGGTEQGMKVLSEMNSLVDEREQFEKSLAPRGGSALGPVGGLLAGGVVGALIGSGIGNNQGVNEPFHDMAAGAYGVLGGITGAVVGELIGANATPAYEFSLP